MKKGIILLPIIAFGLASCGSKPSTESQKTSIEPQYELIETYDFTVLTGSGSEITDPHALLSRLGTSVYWESATKVFDGNGTGGVREANPTGLLKFGTTKQSGVLTFSLDENVTRMVLGCHSFYGVSEEYPTNRTDFVKVNDMAPVVAPYNSTGASENLEFNLSPATNSITITSCNENGTLAGRFILFSISLYR